MKKTIPNVTKSITIKLSPCDIIKMNIVEKRSNGVWTTDRQRQESVRSYLRNITDSFTNEDFESYITGIQTLATGTEG